MNHSYRNWLLFSSLVFQVALVMFLSVRLGLWLDNRYHHEDNIYTLGLVTIGMIVIIISIYRQTKKFK
ncbi:MAG: AtpZ/AtpI family protein [Flavobacteriaceae bacterium]|nr:AtpZ/AtpI family protein [Flavobacteriaceae bacterium]MCY4268006.1 AtpZ/AtpI family protein [Flavobacteriaceae bacterium]MCY4298203.1 AtpZ/AtpI family protein [Flavobacteriaceae bacterium]